MSKTRSELTAENDSPAGAWSSWKAGPLLLRRSEAPDMGPAGRKPIGSGISRPPVRYRRPFEIWRKTASSSRTRTRDGVTDREPIPRRVAESRTMSHTDLPRQDALGHQTGPGSRTSSPARPLHFRHWHATRPCVRCRTIRRSETKDGSPKTGGVREQPLPGRRKKKPVQCNIRDITERRHVEEGVRKSNEELSALRVRAAVARQRDAVDQPPE